MEIFHEWGGGQTETHIIIKYETVSNSVQVKDVDVKYKQESSMLIGAII